MDFPLRCVPENLARMNCPKCDSGFQWLFTFATFVLYWFLSCLCPCYVIGYFLSVSSVLNSHFDFINYLNPLCVSVQGEVSCLCFAARAIPILSLSLFNSALVFDSGLVFLFLVWALFMHVCRMPDCSIVLWQRILSFESNMSARLLNKSFIFTCIHLQYPHYMTEYFAYTVDAAGNQRRPHDRVTRKTVPGIDAIQFPQWTAIDLPDLYDGFFWLFWVFSHGLTVIFCQPGGP